MLVLCFACPVLLSRGTLCVTDTHALGSFDFGHDAKERRPEPTNILIQAVMFAPRQTPSSVIIPHLR